jgi:hypothetical protein
VSKTPETPETEAALERAIGKLTPEYVMAEKCRELEIQRDMLRKALEIAVDKWAKFVPCSHCVRIRATNGEHAEYCHPYEPKVCRKVISDWLTAMAAKG